MHDLSATNTPKPAGTKNRHDILKEIRERLGPNTPLTLRLIDSLIAAWDVTDLLSEVFNKEQAQVYIQAGFEAIEVIDDDL